MRFIRAIILMLTASLVLAGFSSAALARGNDFYIIDDSDSRYLTEEELWQWQYNALGYIYNEIFARHGRPFRSGEKYDVYFRGQDWYQVNPQYRYGLLNRVEQANEKLVHQVLGDMRALKTTNPKGKPLPASNEQAAPQSAIRFRSYRLSGGRKLEVYTGPGTNYYRSANGKASVSTNGDVEIAGVENGWALVRYEISGGAKRIGYVQQNRIGDKLALENLEFVYEEGMVVATPCHLTDEPDGYQRTTLATLPNGTYVTLLGPYTMTDQLYWCYVEAQTDRGLMRGFVPVDCITGSVGEYMRDQEAYGVDDYDWDDEANQENG